MNLPELPPALHGMEWQHTMYTKEQMLKLQADTIEAILKTCYEQCTPYGKPGECAWIGIKAAVRYAQKSTTTVQDCTTCKHLGDAVTYDETCLLCSRFYGSRYEGIET
jgi:hypothetical protein